MINNLQKVSKTVVVGILEIKAKDGVLLSSKIKKDIDGLTDLPAGKFKLIAVPLE